MTLLKRLFSRRRLEAELDAELRDHLDRQIADYVRAGLSEADARRQARHEFGGLDQIKELCRDARGTRWLDEIAQDVRYGIRGFLRNRGFTAVAVFTLALGIGVNIAVFSLVDALLLRRLPVHAPGQLVSIWRVQGSQSSQSFSYPQVLDLAKQEQVLSGLAAYSTADIVHVGPADAREPTAVAWVNGDYFRTLGLAPLAGRLLDRRDDRADAPPAAVISDAYWARRFGRDPGAIERPLLIDDVPVTIAGVTPRGFAGAVIGEAPDLMLAIQARRQLQPDRAFFLGAGTRWLRVLARPREAVPREQVKAHLALAWSQSLPAGARARGAVPTLDLRPGVTGSTSLERFETPVVVTMALVVGVLLVACVNVANLLLARATTRQREIALRLAIGASRGRVVRQLLTESVLLAAAGVFAGILIAAWSSAALVGLLADGRPGQDVEAALAIDLLPDWRMFAFAALVAACATLVCGVAPALRASTAAPTWALNAGSSRIAGPRGRLAPMLVTAQVALCLLLLTGAGLFARTLHNLRTVERGFAHEDVVLVGVDATRAGYDRTRGRQLILDAVATLTSVTPLEGGGISQKILVNGTTIEDELYFNNVGPGYFSALTTAVVRGREFTWQDDEAATRVAIVNESFARRYMTGDPLGQRVAVEDARSGDMEVVGVVADAAYESLRDAPPPTVYAPFLQRAGDPGQANLVIRAPRSAAAVAAAMRAELTPKLAGRAPKVRTLTWQLESSLTTERLLSKVSTVFGLLALTIAAVGLYGLLAYWVTSRTREIGVRVALGATRGRVVGLVLRDALRMVALGIAVGLPAAGMLSRQIASMLFGVAPQDAATSAGAVLVLSLAALLAALVPARRATAIDPHVALRSE